MSKTISIILMAVLSFAIISTAAGLTEAGRIKVRYTEVDTYNGKGKIVISNLDADAHKTLVKADLNFGKQHKSQGESCCVKTYEFKNGGNDNGDRLFVKVTANGGSWTQHETFHAGTLNIRVSMDEVDCGDDC